MKPVFIEHINKLGNANVIVNPQYRKFSGA